MEPNRVAGAILAGGRARRLGGADKALVKVGGRAIVVRQIAALSTVADEILLVVDRLGRLPKLDGTREVVDRDPGLGPLAGLAAALAATELDVLLVGCDLPFLDERLLRIVRDESPGADAVVPIAGGRLQPLHARYSHSTRARIASLVAAGTRSMHDALARLANVKTIDERVLRAIDPSLRGLVNVNTPDELAAARRLAGEE